MLSSWFSESINCCFEKYEVMWERFKRDTPESWHLIQLQLTRNIKVWRGVQVWRLSHEWSWELLRRFIEAMKFSHLLNKRSYCISLHMERSPQGCWPVAYIIFGNIIQNMLHQSQLTPYTSQEYCRASAQPFGRPVSASRGSSSLR